MGSYPQDFPIPSDRGGPGAGAPLGGFGGNLAADRDSHRDVLARVGKAPVLLVHGNGGTADVRPWDLLDLRRFLLAAGYPEELVWAPSYLGSGSVDLLTPHSNNVDDVRGYLNAVCEYMGVEVVDIIAHSLGCTLMYAVFRGLDRQSVPVSWNQPKEWHRVGTFVALAGGFHGLGTASIGEWRTGGEFMKELLAETDGGGGETPFAVGKPQTPASNPHTITYFCGIAAGDFIDAQNPGTGKLIGATNNSYNLGAGQQGHQAVKESLVVFNDFLPLLNSVPPPGEVALTVDKDTGEYAGPLAITVSVEPPSLDVSVIASRLTREFRGGYLVDEVAETRNETLRNGQTCTLETPGMWQVTGAVAGAADDLTRTYWVGVTAPVTMIVTDAGGPFDSSLLVMARTSDPTARLYYSLDGATWNEGAAVTIAQDSVVSFIAIKPDGVASAIATRSFTKRIPWEEAVTADAVAHFISARIDVSEFLAYSDQFGFFTPFALYLVDGDWVLDPQNPAGAVLSLGRVGVLDGPGPSTRPLIRVAPVDPQPGQQVSGPLTVTIEAPGAGQSITVHYTRDGSIPTTESASFSGSARFGISEPGNHVIACYAKDSDGHENYQAFPYSMTRTR